MVDLGRGEGMYAPEDRLDADAPLDGVDAEQAAERDLRGRGLL